MTDTSDRPTRGEAPLSFGETFFSRTDKRGVIQAGNAVFQRVSHYPWSKLIGAPHKLVRHADMPKGFFQLFWTRLHAGKSVSGYVKNSSEDGLHYWVYAVAIPLDEEGYLSVRIKPGSEHFARAQTLYAELTEAEREDGLAPEASAGRLVERLAEEGFGSYQAFMAESLSAELANLDNELRNVISPRGLHFARLYKEVTDARSQTRALSSIFEAIEGIPHNMRILASRLEASGGPIAAISSNYGSISQQISDWARTTVDGDDSTFRQLDACVQHSRFLSGVARIMEDVVAQFDAEAPDPDCPVDRAAEQARLARTATDCRSEAESELGNLERLATRFSEGLVGMKRLIAGLSTTRMMCKIESASLPQHSASLMAIIDQLDDFQSQIEERLDRLGSHTAAIVSSARALEADRASVGGSETLARAS